MSLVDDLKSTITNLSTNVNLLLDRVNASPRVTSTDGSVTLSPQDVQGLIKTLSDLSAAVAAVTIKLTVAGAGEPEPVEPVSPPHRDTPRGSSNERSRH